MPFGDDGLQPFAEQIEFRGGVVDARRLYEPWMAGGLPQTCQRRQNLHALPAVVTATDKLPLVVVQQIVIFGLLLWRHFAEKRLLRLCGQVLCDLCFCSPQDERPDGASYPRNWRVVAFAVRRGRRDDAFAPEKPWIQELQLTVEFSEAVLDGRACHCDSMAGVDAAGGACGGAVEILDGL